MKFKDYYQKFSDEAQCRQYWRQLREQQGVVCKQCQCKVHLWKNDKQLWQCKKCKFRTTLRSGTVMENSKLPFGYWLAGMQFLTVNKKSFSALSVQKELGHKRYEPIWNMLHKLRLVMGYRDASYKLTEVIELDEGFFEHVNKAKDVQEELASSQKNKRGRGSQKQSKVLVAVESRPLSQEQAAAHKNKGKHKKDRKVGYMKMIVMDAGLNADAINFEVGQHIYPQAQVLTDGYSGYNQLHQKVRKHSKVSITKPQEAGKFLPWVHTAISNAKRLLLDVFHRIDGKYMQNYLNEYCYRFNRRYFKELVFDRLAIAGVSYTWYGKEV